MRGVRGAITVETNSREAILAATSKLLEKMVAANNIQRQEMVSIIFTTTSDLDQEYPAVAARQLGYVNVPLMNYQELSVSDSLSKCIRIMIYINRTCSLDNIDHIYLKNAKSLRPDLVENRKER